MASRKNNEWNIDGTLFSFPDDWRIEVFDEWPQYKKAASELGLRGCDVLCLDDTTLWIVEMKDYTYPGASQPSDLDRIVGEKAAGTMALLYALQRNPSESDAQKFARACKDVTRIHLAMHIEVKDGGRKAKQVGPLLMPLKNKLRKMQMALGISKSFVTSTHAPNSAVGWTSRRDPDGRQLHLDR